ncbi:hypothetical protein [Brevundimonas sp.]|nr:hypothetical protein [Brevundimonas sp.]MBJ7484682.1 hypothetical protein [Brevundimonas sp.]
MKLSTLADGTPDGRLVLVSRDLKRAIAVADIAATLQQGAVSPTPTRLQ